MRLRARRDRRRSKYDLAHQSESTAQMIGGGRGAERGDRIGEPGLVQTHRIHVALDHDQSLERLTREPGLVQSVELAPL